MFGRSWRIVVALMLILYGSVSFCGSGLHWLAESSGSHTPSHDHGSNPILRADHSDCALCDCLAQGQLTAEPVRIASRPFTSPHVRLVLAVVATRDRPPACSPRAPPTAL
jgi:hypothetical protein